ncbi:GNAT superfamily N-acetyltransferase [Allocatelliglobosispora scoriae]|uniref:GNAT superfamily N-acetyltransferase n=1 Tax=Allocatelliglobosispora scoriae TaxID=643052 RepID=A0A841BVA5_9ACTN|nr:GNAT family N-acetyltransferase [Allocatelliglobosispora scoriae]MBB5871615.1 GNAT superfamily N-acetyltransferase [Allocatelliglobosispora scoriae]
MTDTLSADTLPEGWSLRHPTLDDVPAILAVAHASDIAAVGAPDFSTEDVLEALTGPYVDPAKDSWVALDPDGAIVAWAFIENGAGGPREFVEVYVDPARGAAARRTLLMLALARVPQRAAELGHPRITARAGAIPTETEYIALLKEVGFTFIKRYARMLIELPVSLPQELPEGVEIRTITRDDLPVFHRVFDTAFRDTPDYQPAPLDVFLQRYVDSAEVRWDEWFLATVDGEPAGVLQSSDQALDQNEGWVKHLAVLKEHRRRGVGQALLARAFGVYASKGRTLAGLGVDLANPTEAVRLYHAVGMHAKYEADIFELPAED